MQKICRLAHFYPFWIWRELIEKIYTINMSFLNSSKKEKQKSPEIRKLKTPEKPQAELREALNKRFLGMKDVIKQATEEYKTALQDGSFEVQEGEEENAGEDRKEAMQSKINALFDKAEQMKKKLDSKEKLPQYAESLTATYKQESITLNLDQKLEEYLDFYKKNKLDMPPDFEEQIKEIWENNIDDMQKAIEENGFNDILLIPGNLSLVHLNSKMTKNYKNPTYESDNFKSGGSFAGAKSQNADKPRIVLVHKVQNLKDNPELAKTLNIKGQDVDRKNVLTLEDYLVFQRKYFEETEKHLDADGYTWLATESGARLVDAFWYPGFERVIVDANGLGNQYGNLGARPSRSFFK